MKRRYLSLWLKNWPIDRHALALKRQGTPVDPGRPAALLVHEKSADRLYALNDAARGLGLRAMMVLADARAAVPDLALYPADLAADAQALTALAHWCGRYSPWVMVDGDDGVLIDISGCAHLFGGEAGLIEDLRQHAQHFGLTCRIAVADRAAEAWAWCRFGTGGILAVSDKRTKLHALPVAALRLEEALLAKLRRLGLHRIGDVAGLPRASLLRRFDASLALRLDQMFASAEEPFIPLRDPKSFQARLSWPEPIGRTEDIAAAIGCLAKDLCRHLEQSGLGARRLRLKLCRIDGQALELKIGTSAPSHNANHLARLFQLELDALDVGFGIELMLLEALEVAAFERVQENLIQSQDQAALNQLIDQLQNRLGKAAVVRLEPVQSHVPERAQHWLACDAVMPAQTSWLARQPRPLRLFDQPRHIEAMAAVPDGPPVLLKQGSRRVRISHASGPERISSEWWLNQTGATDPRDYYAVVTAEGSRLWLFREGQFDAARPPRWWLQGAFD